MSDTVVNDNVQNQIAIASRFCTESPSGQPLFFIGSSPSQAQSIINPSAPAAGVMVSVNQLRNRKSDFQVDDWILDSGAFTEIARHGGYRSGVEEYYWQICRWARCGNLLIAVAQDWMCEKFVLERTGLSISEHQKLTIERYDQLLKFNPPVPIMPVLQGYKISDYLSHLQQYSDHLKPNQWVGIGSVCRRNGSPDEIADILKSIKLIRPDLRLHGFGLKILALENLEVRQNLYSCDSMAWSYPLRFRPEGDSVQNPKLNLAHSYQAKITAVNDSVHYRQPPSTAGAGNGQGRKPKWNSPTKAIRIPEKYADKLIELARQWESGDNFQ